jgi:hypothetical protein
VLAACKEASYQRSSLETDDDDPPTLVFVQVHQIGVDATGEIPRRGFTISFLHNQDAELRGVTEIYLSWFNSCIVDDSVSQPGALLMS